MNAAASGAYTGEVSASMLKGVGVHTVILGHSERRSLFHETDAGLASKVKSALDADMEVIFCFGEELKERKSNTHFDVVAQQIRVALFDLPVSAWKQIILAYEPCLGHRNRRNRLSSPSSRNACLHSKFNRFKLRPGNS
jgi:triosephosphate isomerase